MKRLAGRVFPLSLAVALLLLSGVASAAPLVYLQLLARPDGTTQPFSSTITPTAVGEAYDYTVVATLAPAGTFNANLLASDPTSNGTIGSWQYNMNELAGPDGIQATVYSLYQSSSATSQVSFMGVGYAGATGKGGAAAADTAHVANSPITTDLTLSGATNNPNALYNITNPAGAAVSQTYTYANPSGEQTPNGISQSATGQAFWDSWTGTGTGGGTPTARAGGAGNDLLHNAVVGSQYQGIDDATVDMGTNQRPITTILTTGSSGSRFTTAGSTSTAKINNSMTIESLGSGTSTVYINTYDLFTGGGALGGSDKFLSIAYNDNLGNQIQPGTGGVFSYSAQTGSDPVVAYVPLAIVGPTAFTWTNTGGSGNWINDSNWSPSGGPPNAVGAIALFASTSPAGVVTLDGNQSIGSLRFNNGSSGSGMTIAAGNPAGTLTLDSGVYGASANVTVTAGLHLVTAPVFFNSPVNVSITTVAPGTGLTISGPISNGPSGLGNSLTLSGGGTLTLASTSNTFIGTTTVSGGNLVVTGNLASGNAVAVENTGILSGTGTVGGGVSLAGGATGAALSSSGTLTLSSTLAVSGSGNAISGGTISVAGGTTVNSGGSLAINGTLDGSLAVSNGGSFSGTGTIQGSVTFSGTSTSSFNGVIADGSSSSSTLAVNASGGTLFLGAAGNYSGPTTIGSGVLEAGLLDVIPSMSAVSVANGGQFELNGFSQSIGSLTGNGSVTNNGSANVVLTVGNDNSSPAPFSGTISNTTGSGTGTLALTGPNTYSGGTVIESGTLRIGGDSALGAAPSTPTTNVTFTGSATLQFANGFTGPLSANRGLLVDSGVNATLDSNSNTVTGGGPLMLACSATLTKTDSSGTGTFEFDAAPSLGNSSGLRVNSGTLRFSATSGSPTIGSGVTATVASEATLELGGSISQLNQAVNIANAGTLLVSSSANQNVGVITGAGNTVVNTEESLTAYQIVQNSLTIGKLGTLALMPSGSGSTSNPTGPNNNNYSVCTLNSLTIASFGTLDIGNSGLVVQYGSGADPYSAINTWIELGYDGGTWLGPGITSSLARAAVASGSKVPALNIGLIDFTPGAGNYTNSTFMVFEGQTITTDAVLVRLTYMDDLALAGSMLGYYTTDDALLFAANYGSGTTWSVGDLVHTGGPVGQSDALLFAANFVVGLPSLDGTTGNEAALGGSEAAVPEPASAAIAAIGAILVALRFDRLRRRRVS